MPMDIRLRDRVEMKKPHPCGEKIFEITRVGMDVKLRCTGCGHEVMLPRPRQRRALKRFSNGRRKPMNKKTRAMALILVVVMIVSLLASMVIPFLV